MDKRKEVHDALADWIIRVIKTPATPEEITALPGVAKVFFENQSLFSSSPTNE